jgi:hypothetical protein
LAAAEWRGKEAVIPLLDIARAGDNATYKVLALRGAVRLAGGRGMAVDEKAMVLAEAMKLADRAEEKREVLAALGGMQTPAALKLAAACLEDDAVKEEAAAAVVQIAETVVKQDPKAVVDPLTKAAKVAKDQRVRDRAQAILTKAGKQ